MHEKNIIKFIEQVGPCANDYFIIIMSGRQYRHLKYTVSIDQRVIEMYVHHNCSVEIKIMINY